MENTELKDKNIIKEEQEREELLLKIRREEEDLKIKKYKKRKETRLNREQKIMELTLEKNNFYITSLKAERIFYFSFFFSLIFAFNVFFIFKKYIGIYSIEFSILSFILFFLFLSKKNKIITKTKTHTEETTHEKQ